MRLRAAAFALCLVGGGAATVIADDIYRWTDAQGRVHFSNRGGDGADDSGRSDAPSGGEGWESVLERNAGGLDVRERAEAAINGLEVQMIRKKRERTAAEDELKATEGDIVRATTANPASLPDLKQREATEIGALRRIDLEIAVMTAKLDKLRAMKATAAPQPPH